MCKEKSSALFSVNLSVQVKIIQRLLQIQRRCIRAELCCKVDRGTYKPEQIKMVINK